MSLTEKRFREDEFAERLLTDLVTRFLSSLGGSYAEITNTRKKAKIENNADNNKLLEILDGTNYISSYSKTIKGLIVNHRRR